MSKAKSSLLAKGPFPAVPKTCVVTGSSGFVGQRLVEMLVERGARVTVRNRHGLTAAQVAKAAGHAEIAAFLKEKELEVARNKRLEQQRMGAFGGRR